MVKGGEIENTHGASKNPGTSEACGARRAPLARPRPLASRVGLCINATVSLTRKGTDEASTLR